MLLSPQRMRTILHIRTVCQLSRDRDMREVGQALDDLLAERVRLAEELARQNAVIRKQNEARAARERQVLGRPRCSLSVAQLETVLAAACGEHIEQTARRMSAAVDTVKSRRRAVVARLGARSMTHAVALCMDNGWITPEDILTPTRSPGAEEASD